MFFTLLFWRKRNIHGNGLSWRYPGACIKKTPPAGFSAIVQKFQPAHSCTLTLLVLSFTSAYVLPIQLAQCQNRCKQHCLKTITEWRFKCFETCHCSTTPLILTTENNRLTHLFSLTTASDIFNGDITLATACKRVCQGG